MKYFFIIITSFLILSSVLFGYDKVSAASLTCSGIGSPVQCPLSSFGDDVEMSVTPINNNGDVIMGAVTYTWTLLTPNLGALTVLTPSTLTLGAPSKAKITIGYVLSEGFVQVAADYGGDIKIKVFKLSASCKEDPKLVYGIGGVSKAGVNNYQYSTAEVLLTCYPEYKLYEGDGSK